MFADCIKKHVHPATWAVLGIKKNVLGDQIAHKGTGFAVDSTGHILTCWHVTFMDQDCTIECDEFIVSQPELGPAMYPATLVSKEKDRDIALLKITGVTKTKPVRLFGGLVPHGTSSCAFGHPLSITDPTSLSMRIFTRATAGIVSMPFLASRFPPTREVKLYELDFFSHGGASGGPVVLRNGDVFAFVSGSRMLDDGSGNKTRSNLSLAIDVREAIEFLKPLNVDVKVRWGTS